MPELPEVETVANGVNARIRGQRIVGAWFSDKREPMKTPPARMEQVLTGAIVERVYRVGKTVVFDLIRSEASPVHRTKRAKSTSASPQNADQSEDSGRAQWLVHLGMTGRLLVNDAAVEKPKHTHAVLTLAGGQELRFVDPRRFGRMSIHGMEGPDLGRGGGKSRTAKAANAPKRSTAPGVSRPASAAKSPPPARFSGTGAEPLAINLQDFAALFRGRATPIKAALLNQKLLHGVGNIYADEALFRAGVRPARKAARVTRVEMERLRVGLVEVLRQAIALGGSSVSDYVDAEGSRGFFQLEHRVYQRTGQPCLVCATPIQRKVIGGRSSHFCSACQK